MGGQYPSFSGTLYKAQECMPPILLSTSLQSHQPSLTISYTQAQSPSPSENIHTNSPSHIPTHHFHPTEMWAIAQAFSPRKLAQHLLFAPPQHGPPPITTGNRKSQRPKSYKPPPLVTRLQQFKRQATSRASSSRSSSYSSTGSSSTSSESPPTPPSFERAAADAVFLDDDAVFLRMEFARLQLRSHWHGEQQADEEQNAPWNPLEIPSILDRMEHQHSRDRASLASLPTQAPPIFYRSFQAPTRPRTVPSRIIKEWHLMKLQVDALQWEKQTVARAQGDTTVERWAQYEKKWAVALDAEDSPPLAFCHVPWPIRDIAYEPRHITPLAVHQFLFCAETVDAVKPDVLPRLAKEIRRWRPETFQVRVLPLVLPHQRELADDAAQLVLEILIAAQRDIKRSFRPKSG
ncbi:hypothetical protein B0H11DRAFT_777298 [Mycena galericulata]|nr:hypothetical protein B0H11DRAFT_777298 [Mycena galericulata]